MDFLFDIWKQSYWTKNAILAPITVGIVVAIISTVSTWFIKKYLKAQDSVSHTRYEHFISLLSGFDKKLTAFCVTNHEEHDKADKKLLNHDHDPDTGKPRFYV